MAPSVSWYSTLNFGMQWAAVIIQFWWISVAPHVFPAPPLPEEKTKNNWAALQQLSHTHAKWWAKRRSNNVYITSELKWGETYHTCLTDRPPFKTGPVIYQEVICVSNAQPTLVPSLERIIQGRDGPLSSAHIGQHCILSVPNID